MSKKNDLSCYKRQFDWNEPHCNSEIEPVRAGRHKECQHAHSRMRNIRQTADYETMDSDNKIVINLRDLGHMLRFLFEGRGSQKRILIILREAGRMTQRELTERLGIQPGSASEVLGKLERAGSIERKLSQSDRRTTDVQLTEQGQVQAEEAARQRKTRHQEMFSCLSEEEKDTLLALIEKLNADWDNRYRGNDKGRGRVETHENDHSAMAIGSDISCKE